MSDHIKLTPEAEELAEVATLRANLATALKERDEAHAAGMLEGQRQVSIWATRAAALAEKGAAYAAAEAEQRARAEAAEAREAALREGCRFDGEAPDARLDAERAAHEETKAHRDHLLDELRILREAEPHQFCAKAIETFRTRAEAAEAREAALREALDRDKTGLAAALNKIIAEIRGRSWLLEGRGPYEWNDDHYKDEAGLAMRAARDIAEAALSASGKLALAALSASPPGKLYTEEQALDAMEAAAAQEAARHPALSLDADIAREEELGVAYAAILQRVREGR